MAELVVTGCGDCCFISCEDSPATSRYCILYDVFHNGEITLTVSQEDPTPDECPLYNEPAYVTLRGVSYEAKAISERHRAIRLVSCPYRHCMAKKGKPCHVSTGPEYNPDTYIHKGRLERARRTEAV